MIWSIWKNKVCSLFYFNGFAIHKCGKRYLKSGDLARISCCWYSQYSGSFSNSTCVSVVNNHKIFNNYVFSSTYCVQIIKSIIYESLIFNGDVTLLWEKIENLFAFQDCNILIEIVTDCNFAWVLNLHWDQLWVY